MIDDRLRQSGCGETDGASLPRPLYISFDGLLEPLGRSQVLSYLYKLSEQGFSYKLISLERSHDLKDAARVAELERELAAHGIDWIRLTYHTGGARAAGKNFRAALGAARRLLRQNSVDLIHARSYFATAIAWVLHRTHGVPYIFDMRGYWIDELADDGRWFTNRLLYKTGKLVESRLLKDAASVVTLTKLQADDLRDGLLKRYPEKPIEVITTCADYDEFDPQRAPRDGAVPQEVLERLQGKLRVGLIGSVNASYCLRESFQLFRHLLEARPDAHLLCLTRQTGEMRALLDEHQIPADAYTLATVQHEDMAEWLRHMDWALLLLNTRYSKRGSMPTKLAEFFAAGVRPVQYGCNEEVSQKIREAGAGLVLSGLSPEDLREAAAVIAATPLTREETLLAREATRSHFSLTSGVEKYAALMMQRKVEKKP